MSKQDIKLVALKHFATKGYEATTMREIAKELGLAAPSIYSHYKSKETIYLELVEDLKNKFAWECVENISPSNFNLHNILLDVYIGYYTYFSTNRIDLLFWQRSRYFPPAGLENKYDINSLLYSKPTFEVYIELFQHGVLHGHIGNSNIPLLVMSFFVFVSGFIDSLLLTPVILDQKQLTIAFDIFWKGINNK